MEFYLSPMGQSDRHLTDDNVELLDFIKDGEQDVQKVLFLQSAQPVGQATNLS